jgi:hypothetical protein
MLTEGLKVGRLKLVDRAPDHISDRGATRVYMPVWWVECECGHIFKLRQSMLETGEYLSCGCDGMNDYFYIDATEGDYEH